jgi:hypothetical protein
MFEQQATFPTQSSSQAPENLFLVDPLRGGDSTQDRTQCPDSQRIMSRNGNSMMNWLFGLENYVASDLMNLFIREMSAKDANEIGATNIAGFSCAGKNFVTNQVQTNPLRLWLIVKIRVNGFLDVHAQIVPGICLREDVVR